MIATGFDATAREDVGDEQRDPSPSERLDALTRERNRDSDSFELPRDVLEIPSFLRDE